MRVAGSEIDAMLAYVRSNAWRVSQDVNNSASQFTNGGCFILKTYISDHHMPVADL
jgi:hypothetical protein